MIKYRGYNERLTQFEVNNLFEGHNIDIAENYSFVIRLLYLSFWYASVAPIGMIFCFLGLLTNYWMDKYMLLRVNCFPENINEEIVKKVTKIMEIIVFLYILGAGVYTTRKLNIRESNLVYVLSDFIYYGISNFIIIILLIISFVCWRNNHKFKNHFNKRVKYNELRSNFVTEYDRINPMTQKKANKNWLEFMKKKSFQDKEIKGIM